MTEQEADFRALEQILNWTEAEVEAAAERWAFELGAAYADCGGCHAGPSPEGADGPIPRLKATWPRRWVWVNDLFEEAQQQARGLGRLGIKTDGAAFWGPIRKTLVHLLLYDVTKVRAIGALLAQGEQPARLHLHELAAWANERATVHYVDWGLGARVVHLGSVAKLVRAVRGLWPVAMGKATLEQCARDVVTSRPAGLIELVGNPDQTCGRWFVKGGTGRKAKEYCGQCTDKARRAVRRRERKAQQATG